jgi:aryl-alcohol dehydrogenase-like predicted oxidoreductase
MGFDYVDLIYANPPPQRLPVAEMVGAVGELLRAGKARTWGIVNWEAGQFQQAVDAAAAQGLPAPCAAQLPYSLVRRDWVESPEMDAVLSASGAGVVASFSLAGGILTGKYDSGGRGRSAAEIGDPRVAVAREQGRRLKALADELGSTAGALAIAFAFANPAVVTVLFGATSPVQIADSVRALDVSPASVQRILEVM